MTAHNTGIFCSLKLKIFQNLKLALIVFFPHFLLKIQKNQGWVKWYLPQEQGFKMKTYCPNYMNVMDFLNFSLSCPGSGAPRRTALYSRLKKKKNPLINSFVKRTSFKPIQHTTSNASAIAYILLGYNKSIQNVYVLCQKSNYKAQFR